MTMIEVPTNARQAAADEELRRLFAAYRHADLRVRYYGCLMAWYDRWIRWPQAIAAMVSAAALAALLLTEHGGGRLACGVIVALTAVIGPTVQALGWSERAKQLYFLHRANCLLFAQIGEVMTAIRREDALTDEQRGGSRAVMAAYHRLDALDEEDSDQELVAKLDQQVRAAFPPDYIWTSL